jgi:hypothetical protein
MLLYAIVILSIFGLVSPIYYLLLNGKIRNETAFLITWVTTPMFLIYTFYINIGYYSIVFTALMTHVLGIFFSIKKKRIIWSGIYHFISLIIIYIFSYFIL